MKGCILIVGLWMLLALAGVAEDFTEARQALARGLPHAAIHLLRDRTPADGNEAVLAGRDFLLARALLDAGRSGEVIELMADRNAAGETEAVFWTAQARMAKGQPAAAAEGYRTVLEVDDFGFANEARLALARALAAMGENAEALDVLDTVAEDHPVARRALLERISILIDSRDMDGARDLVAATREEFEPTHERFAYLEGLVQLEAGDYPAALERLQPVARADSRFGEPAAVAAARCLVAMEDFEAAEELLEGFLREFMGRSPPFEVFAELDRVYSLQSTASSAELRRLVEDETAPERSAAALYYLARNEARSGRTASALERYQEFLDAHRGHILEPYAAREAALFLLLEGRSAEALALLKPLANGEAETDFLLGTAAFALGRFNEAAAWFLAAAESNENMAAVSFFNAAICQLLGGISDGEPDAFALLEELFPGDPRIRRFRHARALHGLALHDPDAADVLAELVEMDMPLAALALAEWMHAQLLVDEASHYLAIASEAGVQPERTAYLELFLLHDQGADSQTILGRCEDFLREFPDSGFASDVRMKMAEILFQTGDYLAARVALETLAADQPGTSLAERAYFLAGQACARLMTDESLDQAISNFEEAARIGGPLATRARFEQALVQSALGKPREAIVLLDRVIETAGEDEDLRFAALIEKGDTLFSEGQNNPEAWQEAIAVWQGIVDDDEVPEAWRNQALCKIGVAYEQLGETDKALGSYYRVLTGVEESPGEYFWFFKAGFDAARLLEEQEAWREAIAIYEQLGALDGPRTAEARLRANRLRLENFIWED